MKHSKDRLTARERAASAFIVLAFIGFSIFDADKLWRLVSALVIVVGMLAIGALILNWPEIKNYLKGMDTYGQASNTHPKSDKVS